MGKIVEVTTVEDMLKAATPEAKSAAADILVAVGTWALTRANHADLSDSLPAIPSASSGSPSKAAEILALARAVNVSLDAKVKSKEEGAALAQAILQRVFQVAMQFGVTALMAL